MHAKTLLAAAAALHAAEAFAPGPGAVPGLRTRGGVHALAMSGEDKCEQVRRLSS
jgi:hypothetical protein